MKNYENRLKAIQKVADGKTAKVVFLDYKNGKYYQDGKEVDINTVKASAIIVDNIPDTPPEFLEKGGEENESDG
mgnify:CR=1 FL=1